jgi:hypothetical protein
MRIPTQIIKDTIVTDQEKCDAALIYLYHNTFEPLLAIRMFSSFQLAVSISSSMSP